MIQQKLGRRISELRRSGHLTQRQLAKSVGCSVDFISMVERGVNAPSVANLEKLARTLHVSLGELFTFKRGQPGRHSAKHKKR